jgi:hypothetical protein
MDPEIWLLKQFLRWEVRGRGWILWVRPVELEPPFRRFEGHYLPKIPDDGRRSTALGRLARWVLAPTVEQPVELEAEEVEEPEPATREADDDLVELQLTLPPGAEISAAWLEQCLFSLPRQAEPLSFELVGTEKGIVTQFVCRRHIAELVQRQLTDHLPSVIVVPGEGCLAAALGRGEHSLTADFGLGHVFMVPLPTLNKGADPYVGLVAAMAQLREDEAAVVQVLFERVHHPWSESAWRAITDNSGGPFFTGRPELLSQTKAKLSRPLFSVGLRIGVRAGDFERSVDLGRSLSAAFGVFRQPGANHLVPLDGSAYHEGHHEADLLARTTHRSGMLLNSDELLSLVHLPGASVRNPKLFRDVIRTKAAPASARRGEMLLGTNVHAGITTEVLLTTDQRTRHVHVIGTSGTGKSTLLLNMMVQDADQGAGFALLDPHGDLVDHLLDRLPKSRWDDVILLDAADDEFPFGLNLLDAHSNLERTLLASDLVAAFQRLSTAWGDSMTSILGNAILAFLESTRGGTLPELRRFLVDEAFRREFLPTVTDPEVAYYWEHEYALLRSGSLGPLLTRLDTFLRPKVIRHMVGQRENRLDVAGIMDSGKILLVKLPKGLIGDANAYLLGALLVGKFQQMAIARQAREAAQRRPFFLYVDEFQEFVTPSMATILSGARKYQLGLVLAHQELRQLKQNDEVASSVLANPCVRVCFHVGDQDARWLADGFSSFAAKDLQQLGIGEAICRVERSDNDFNLRTPPPEPVTKGMAGVALAAIRERSRARFARPAAEVEGELAQLRTAVPKKADPFAKRTGKKPEEEPVPPPELEPEPPPSPPPPIRPPKRLPAPPAPVAETAPVKVVSPKPSPAPAPVVAAETPTVSPLGEVEKAESIKNRIIQTAGGFGFSYESEMSVLEGAGRIDLVLTRGELVIACEISATTSAEHEVGNLRKCLRAGYQQIVHLCDHANRRERMKELLGGSASAEELARVRFFSTGDFLRHLSELATAAIAKPSPAAGEKSTFSVTALLTPMETEAETKELLAQLAAKLPPR